jgi:DNA-binding CsgD family transcriptional regulator/PAS domain-containing protein
MATLLHSTSQLRHDDGLWVRWPSPAADHAPRVQCDGEMEVILHGIRDALRADAALSCHHGSRRSESLRIVGCSGGDTFDDDDWAQVALLAQAADRRLPPASARLDDYDWATTLLRLRMYEVLRLSIADPHSNGRMVIALLFGKGRPTNGTASLLEKLRPLIDAHCRLWQQQQQLNARVAGFRMALDTIECAIVIIDRFGKIREANATAKTMIDDGDFLRRSDDTLVAADLADSIALQVAINDAVAANAADPPAGRRMPIFSLRSSRHDRPMFVTVVPCDEPAVDENGAGAVVYALHPDAGHTAQLHAVCKLYGLSQVETRLTLLIVGGTSLQKAAEALHIKEQTARSYLKQVFLKTDTRRQADLVRVVLSGMPPLRSALPVEPITNR